MSPINSNISHSFATATTFPKIVTNGLVLDFDAGQQNSYSGSGTTWTDLSGRGNNGTLTNGPTYNSADGGFIVFDGVDDYVNIGSQSLVGSGTSPFSVELWFYNTKNWTSGQYTLFVRVKQDSEFFIVLYNPSGTLNLYSAFRGFNQWGIPVTQSDYVNKWVCLSVVYNGGDKNTAASFLTYVNGVQLASGTTNFGAAGGAGSNCNIIGADGDSGCNAVTTFHQGNIGAYKVYNRALTATEVAQNYNALKGRFTPDGSLSNPFLSPVQAQSLAISAGTYYFRSGSMSTAQLLEYQPNYYESRPFCCVFRSPYGSTATTNKIDLSIPMAGLLVQRDTLDLRGAVYWSTPITYTTVGGSGNNTADSGTGYAGSNARRVILGNGGGHGLYNTGQQSCNWPSAAGAIGAGYDGGTCGSFPNGLIWGTGRGDTSTYENRSGTWSHWITWS